MTPTNIAIPKLTSLAERIRFIRGARSQREFAERLNKIKVHKAVPDSRIHQAMISRYERGQEMPSPWTLYRIAWSASTKMEWLLTGEWAA